MTRERDLICAIGSVTGWSGTQGNEAVSEKLLQESDGLTSCVWGCTILHKPGHAELVWGDLLSYIMMEVLEHGPVVLTVNRHHPAVIIFKPVRPLRSPSGIEGAEACDLKSFQVPLSDLFRWFCPPEKMLLWLLMAWFKWKCASSLNQIRLIQFGYRSILSLSQLHISSLLLMSS